MKNKILDLHEWGDHQTLEPLNQRVNFVKVVNLTDELPIGLQLEADKVAVKPKQEETDPNKDYNIREMWNRLVSEEPSAMAEAQIFDYNSITMGTVPSIINKTSLTHRTSPEQSTIDRV